MNKLLAGATLLCVLMVLLASNREFEFSDEGLYVLLADPNQENVAGIFNYDFFFKLLHRISGFSFNVVQLRILRLITYLAAAWAMTGFWRNIAREKNLNPEIFWISCLGIFAGFAFLPPTLSYNSLAVVLVCLWLNHLSKQEKSWVTYIFLGFTLAFLVYVKFTVALLFFPLTVLVLFFLQKLRLIDSIFLFLPLILIETLFLIIFEENAFTRLQAGIPMNGQRPGYQVGFMVKSIAVGGFWMITTTLLFFGLGYCKKNRNSFYPALKVISACGILVIGFTTHITEEWNHLVLVFTAAFLGFQFGIGVFKPPKTNFWILLLVSLPFLIHFGSNVPWLRIGIHYAVFWILAARWLLKNKNFEFSIVSSIVGLLLVFNGVWWHPYRHDKPLWSQKVEWQIGEKQVLYIDPQLATIATELIEFNEQHGQTQLLAAYRIPGLVWLTGTTHPFSPGIWEISQLNALFEEKPEAIIYNPIHELPQGWQFRNRRDLGVFRSDSLLVLWD